MGICENIQRLCKKNKLPISHIEKELSLSNGSIRRWNESSPSTEKLQKVAEFFKVSTDYLIYGFHRQWLAAGLKIIRGNRTFTQFVKDTGIDEDELHELCAGTSTTQPSVETVIKIMNDNHLNVPRNNEIFEAAGYDPEEMPAWLPNTPIPNDNEDNEVFELAQKIKKLPPEKKRVLKTITETDQTIAAHRTDDPSSELPEDARKSIEDFKKFIFEKHGIKYD